MAVRRKSNHKVKSAGTAQQAELKFPAPADEKLDIPALETWLWDAACEIRGATDAPKFKDFILPLIFYKRLSNVFNDEFEKCAEQFAANFHFGF